MAMTDHTIRYFSSTTDRPLSCDVCGQLISRDGFLHQRRTLSINVLILVTEGTLYLTANGIPYTVPPNHYIFLHEGEEHFGHRASTGSLSYFWVHFFAAPPFRAVADTFSCQDSAYFFPEYGKLVSPGRILSLFRRLTDLSLDECKNAPRMLDSPQACCSWNCPPLRRVQTKRILPVFPPSSLPPATGSTPITAALFSWKNWQMPSVIRLIIFPPYLNGTWGSLWSPIPIVCASRRPKSCFPTMTSA